MKLKLFTTALIISAFILTAGNCLADNASSKKQIPSSFIYQAVDKYKKGDYTGCIQDMDYLIKNGKASDVAFYYKAISYSRLGLANDAREAYNNAISISNNRSLVEYSTQALACMDNAENCIPADTSDITNFIQSGKFMSDEIIKANKDKAMQKVKEDINKDLKPSKDDLRYINQNPEPTDKEIADAIRTLSRLGINPFGQLGGANLAMYGAQNAEMMQLNALFGNNNNNGNDMMGLLPFLMQQNTGTAQEKSQLSKQFVQAYMLNQMMPGLNFGSNDK